MSYETTDHLVRRARTAGHEIRARRIGDWHRSGLLPKPRKVGLGHGAGSESRYPVGTGDQLLALCNLVEKYPKDLPRVGWELWIGDFKVDEKYWRTPLRETWERIREAARFSFEVDNDPNSGPPILSVAGDEAIKTIGSYRSLPPRIKSIRRRVRSVAFIDLIGQVIRVLVGGFDAQSHDPAVMKHVRHMTMPTTGNIWQAEIY